MGKINAESSINHFSHPHHLLKLVSLQPSTLTSTSSKSNRTICAACTKEAIGLVYVCESCNYCLHKPCSAMPQSLIHKVDQKHALNLLPTPAYEEGSFQCNACGVLGTGFSYHCDECQIDLHTVCAFMRSSVKGSAHHHALELCFDLPITYEDKAFICDVCGGGGSCSNHWLYRCDSCEFDAHLKCAKRPMVKNIQNQQTQLNSLTNKSQQRPHMLNIPGRSSSIQVAGQYLYSPPPVFDQPQVGIGVRSMSEPDPFIINRSDQPSRGRGYHMNNTSAAAMFSAGMGSPRPQVHQTQATRNDVVQNVVQSVIEGFIEGAFNQIGQTIMQGALEN